MTPAQRWSRLLPRTAAVAGLLALATLAAYASRDTALALGLLAAGGVALGAFVLWQAPGLILIVLLLNVWLVMGRADPGDLLQAYPVARWLSYIIIPAFALLVTLRVLARGGRWRLTGLEPFLAGLVLLTILSGVVNHTGPAAIVLSLAIYLRYPLLFLALLNLDLGSAPYLRFARALIWVAVLLVGEAIVSGLVFGRNGDGTFFTTGVQLGTANAGLLWLYALCLIGAHAIVTGWRWFHWAFMGLMVMAAEIAGVRSALVLIPILPFAIWSVHRRLLGRWRLPRLALAALVGIVVFAVALGPRLVDVRLGLGLPYLVQLRLIGVRDVFDAMVPAGREWLGFGPRSFSPGSLGAPGEMYRLLVARRGQYWVDNIGQSELATGFSELGLVGFGVYWLMLAGVLVAALRFRAEYLNAEPDPRLRRRWSILTLGFAGMWLHYALFGLAYYDIWRLDASSLVFWGLAAAIFSQRRAQAQRQAEAPV